MTPVEADWDSCRGWAGHLWRLGRPSVKTGEPSVAPVEADWDSCKRQGGPPVEAGSGSVEISRPPVEAKRATSRGWKGHLWRQVGLSTETANAGNL